MSRDFLQVYDQYYDAIYRYVRFKVGSTWDAEDIVSEVFRKAFEHYAAINGNTKSWLFSIARNAVNDFYRRNKNGMIELQDVFYSDLPTLEDKLVQADELQCLQKSLSGLDGEELDLIGLRYFSELKYEEIGKILGKQSDYLRVKVSRTLKKIGKMVIKCLEG